MDLDSFEIDLEKCVTNLTDDLSQIHTGKASPELVQDILVNAYGTQAPLKNYATINVADNRSLVIMPWDKSIVENISKSISSADMGFNAISEGDHVRVHVPELTEERRKEYVKVMKDRVEDARIAVRQVRQKFMQDIDESQKGGFSQDQADRLREEGEKMVKEKNAHIEEIKDKKEQELLTI
ncbi:ribosome recycling factor [candidate division WS6 bacterium RIFOXYD1_FULL_33_8]|uniref:Ribosome-recycling factor n=2 Tax=Candidatus Dojkabacteria TaxID=74243 RepID=A0A0G0DHI5_9BACT|nr:MAG: ribosome recycling factor, ribosome recycling factor [candidate division WS6 bacterium GW2011_GWE2_33_157]KKP44711.1 MAG: ribosome recycling factor, ribosome recycling factor [candidate division WS6 bacterium GW2011_GWC1_33_20]KKP45641.1 MAG: ribosome recycling factor, ribosome recycling factor [candidate division WS6 bacterium GW2011_GWF1_33_233]KKP54807.1 MAG: Ribosome recycling factor [candidate division WS6 bacterium GW2011_GWB1_33_6]KKP54998.1 MAG: ribosome recycling factor, riboso